MDNEIELISDGDGLAIIGNMKDVERFIESEGLTSKALGSTPLGTLLNAGAVATQAGSAVAANSGRWVKLTKESAENVKKFGLRESSTTGLRTGVVKGDKGQVKAFVEFAKSPGSMAANPAMMANAAVMMSQVAMQQSMNEITDYLAIIDEKLDDVLRAQTNQVLAQLDGVDLAVKEGMSVRDAVGRVSEVTWSKVQNSAQTIHETHGYALRQLGDLADKLEKKSRVDELVKVARDAEVDVQKWLAVLARCFQLHDAIAVLELDRVLDASPDELDRHRLGLRAARRDRIELFSQSTERLLLRMDAAAKTANSKVLFNPIQSPAVIEASNRVALGIDDFHELLEIELSGQSAEARRWRDAASDRWDKTWETGAGGIDTVKSFGGDALGQAKSVKGKLSGRLSMSRFGRGKDDEHDTGD